MIYDVFYYINPAQLYLSAPHLWDALILLGIFLGVSQHVFTKKDSFGKRHGKTLAIAVSLALTFATTVFLYMRGWTLATSGLNIVALVIIFAVLFAILYDLFTNLMGMPAMCAASLAFLFTYPGVQALFGDPARTIAQQQPLLGAFLTLLVVGAVIALFVCIGKLFPKSDDTPPTKPGGDTTLTTKPEKPGKSDKNKLAPLNVALTEPSQKTYPVSAPQIPVHATISGGSGKYEWVVLLNGDAIKHGNTPEVTPRIDNPGVGSYQLIIVVEDGRERAQAEAAFSVSGDQTSNDKPTAQISEDLTGLLDLIGAYKQRADSYAQAAEELLHLRAQNQPTTKQATQVAARAHDVREVLDHIRQSMRNISREEALVRADKQALSEYLQGLEKYYQISANLEKYWREFENRYNQTPPKEMKP